MARGQTGLVSILTVAVVAAVMAGGCGNGGYHYTKNTKYGVYFKVPSTWGRFSADDLLLHTYEDSPDKQPSIQGLKAVLQRQWYVGYDGSGPANAVHLPLGGDRPVVRVKARELLKSERDHFTLDTLRVADLPITQDALDQARTDEAQAKQNNPRGQAVDPNFQTLRDDELHKKGFRGVHYTFNLRVDSAGVTLQTFDIIGWVNEAVTIEYLMVTTCTNACFTVHQSDFTTIASSFTVREQ